MGSRADDANDADATLREPDALDEASGELAPGKRIGRYRLDARIGAGAMGVVWSAFDPQLARKIAIKVVHPALARAPDASSRLLREARAMAKLSHRAVVTVHDAGELDGQLFLAMELVPGTDLGTMLRARDAAARADWPRWLAMVLEAGRGLAAAHRAGVLHRDFKPDNVLVDSQGRVCVGDFGVAALGDDLRTDAARPSSTTMGSDAVDLTTTGALVGTPAYMSPQQLSGGMVDARADQFAFCVTAWEALYGARPFEVAERGLAAIAALAEAIESRRLPDPPPGSSVPAGVRAVLRRGLAPDPADRWPDMDALVAALEGAALAATTGSFSRVAAPGRGVLVLAGVTALAVAAAVIAFVVTRGEPTPPLAVAPPNERGRVVDVKKLFGIAVRTKLGLTPDGRRLVLGGDQIEVRSLDGTNQLWSTRLPKDFAISHVEADDQRVRFAAKHAWSVYRWDYAAKRAVVTEVANIGGRWLGTTAFGTLIYTETGARVGVLRLVDAAGANVHAQPVTGDVEVFSIAPGRDRIAFVEADRFVGTIRVWDLRTNTLVRSRELAEPTAIAWDGTGSLLYATGTQELPTIHRVAVDARGFGREEALYSVPTGWFGELAAHGSTLIATQLSISSRIRVVERNRVARDYDPANFSAGLGWSSPSEFLAWNRSTGQVLVRSGPDSGDATPFVLDAEPANATRAGDLLIVQLRRARGREAIAFSADGKVQWRHGDLKTFAVRCAGDAAPPCFAIRLGGSREAIVPIDPRTGELGATPIYEGIAEDIAVRGDGARVMVARPASILELDATTGQLVDEAKLPLASLRSLAYDPQGGLLVGGTRIRSRYQVGRWFEGTYTSLSESDNDLLSIVRPSPDGARILVLVRVYSPEVYQLTLPPE